MCSWHVRGGALRPVRAPFDHMPHAPQILRGSRVERDRLILAREQALVEHVEHLEERHVGTHVGHVVADKHACELWPRLPQTCSVTCITCSSAARGGPPRMRGLLVEHRLLAHAANSQAAT